LEKINIIKDCSELIKKVDAAILTTIDLNGFLQTRAMLNLRNESMFPSLKKIFENHEDDFLIYFTTNTSSSKVEQIQRNPLVSVYYCKADSWRGFMLGGNIEIIDDFKLKKELWLDNWTMYYPEGVESSDYCLLRLKPKFLKSYQNLSVETINLDKKL
jgi:general stress protein 26